MKAGGKKAKRGNQGEPADENKLLRQQVASLYDKIASLQNEVTILRVKLLSLTRRHKPQIDKTFREGRMKDEGSGVKKEAN